MITFRCFVIFSPLGHKFSSKKRLVEYVEKRKLNVDLNMIDFKDSSAERPYPHTDTEDDATERFKGRRYHRANVTFPYLLYFYKF